MDASLWLCWKLMKREQKKLKKATFAKKPILEIVICEKRFKIQTIIIQFKHPVIISKMFQDKILLFDTLQTYQENVPAKFEVIPEDTQ